MTSDMVPPPGLRAMTLRGAQASYVQGHPHSFHIPNISGMGTVGDEAIVIILCDMRKNGLLAKVKTITTGANL